jgi:hypothetical protein
VDPAADRAGVGALCQFPLGGLIGGNRDARLHPLKDGLQIRDGVLAEKTSGAGFVCLQLQCLVVELCNPKNASLGLPSANTSGRFQTVGPRHANVPHDGWAEQVSEVRAHGPIWKMFARLPVG